MRWRFFIPALTLIVVANALPAEPKEEEKEYIAFPVTTKLQRQCLYSPKHKFIFILNGNALVDEQGRVVASRLDTEKLIDDIGRSRIHLKGDTVSFTALYAKGPVHGGGRFLELAMKGWAEERGYENPSYITSITSKDEWKAILELTKGQRGLIKNVEEESPTGDDLVQAFPVRTTLSRYATSGADCYVRFARPLDKSFDGTLEEGTLKAASAAVEKLGLKEKGRIVFAVGLREGAEKATTTFYENCGKSLAKELGFTVYSVYGEPEKFTSKEK